jgi:hypothetical protein
MVRPMVFAGQGSVEGLHQVAVQKYLTLCPAAAAATQPDQAWLLPVPAGQIRAMLDLVWIHSRPAR